MAEVPVQDAIKQIYEQGGTDADVNSFLSSRGLKAQEATRPAGGSDATWTQGQPEPFGAAVARGLRRTTSQPTTIDGNTYFPKKQQSGTGVMVGSALRDVGVSTAGSLGIAAGLMTGPSAPIATPVLGGLGAAGADIGFDHLASLLEWANKVPNGEHRSLLKQAIDPVMVGMLNAMGAGAGAGITQFRRPMTEAMPGLLAEERTAQTAAESAKRAQLGVLRAQDKVAAIAEKVGMLNEGVQTEKANAATLSGIVEAQPGKAVVTELAQKAQAANEASISPLGDSLINQSRWHAAGKAPVETYKGSGTDYLLGTNTNAAGEIVPAQTKFEQQRAAAAVGFEKVSASYGKGGKFPTTTLTANYQSQLRAGLPMVRTYEQAGATDLPAYLELQNAGGRLTMPQAMLKLQEMGATYARLGPGIEQKALAENLSALTYDIHTALMQKNPVLAIEFSRSRELWRAGIEAANFLSPITNAKSAPEATAAALKLFENPQAVKAMYDTYNPRLYSALAFEKAKEVFNRPTVKSLQAYANMPMISRQAMFGAPLTSDVGVKLGPGMNPKAADQLQTVDNMALESQGAPGAAIQERADAQIDRLASARLDVVHAQEDAKAVADKAAQAKHEAEAAVASIGAQKKEQGVLNTINNSWTIKGTPMRVVRALGSLLPDTNTPGKFLQFQQRLANVNVRDMNSVSTFLLNIPDPEVRHYLMTRFATENAVATEADKQQQAKQVPGGKVNDYLKRAQTDPNAKY